MSGEVHINSCRNCGAKLNGCVRCGRPVVFDAVRVGISFMPSELEQLVKMVTDANVRERILCALGTVDQAAERRARMDLESAADGCPSCAVMAAQLSAAEQRVDEANDQIDNMQAALDDRTCACGY